jgi:adenosine 3'-phospho 5'-phosphosulfate transporter B2
MTLILVSVTFVLAAASVHPPHDDYSAGFCTGQSVSCSERLSLLQDFQKVTRLAGSAAWDENSDTQQQPRLTPYTPSFFENYVAKYFNAQDPSEQLQHPVHAVEHIDMLNNERIWILMGAIVIAMSLVVIRLEVTQVPAKCPETPNEESDAPIFPSWLPGFLEGPRVRLLFCFLALQCSMLLWGIAQEDVMSREYSGPNGEKLKIHASFPILWNRLFSMLFFGCVLACLRRLHIFDGFWMSGAPALSNLMASWCQYSSLHYVTFALQTTAKTTKLLPVVVMNSLRGKPQTLLDYAEAITLVGAIFVFGLETQVAGGASLVSSAIGVVLLLGLVGFDSLTPILQDCLFDKYPKLSSVDVMFATACTGSAVMFLCTLLTGSFFESVNLLVHDPSAMLHLTVLAASSSVVQYFLVYTVQQFGPVVVTIIVSIRQMISVFVSGRLFGHYIPPLAVIGMIMAFFIIFARLVRKPIILARDSRSSEAGAARSPTSRHAMDDIHGGRESDDFLALLRRNYLGSTMSNFGPFFKCALAIHVLYGTYAITQEYLATHTFNGKLFRYPLFLVAISHTCAMLFAICALTAQGLPKLVPEMKFTSLPACADFIATWMQHGALYNLLFPVQTLMKTVKVVPVMLIGRMLRNRTYSTLDYIEGAMLTGLVSYFVVSVQQDSSAFSNHEIMIGVIMMIIYVVVDSFTSPLEDYVYQHYKLDPGQMLLGLESISATLAWIGCFLLGNQLYHAIGFLLTEPSAIPAVLVHSICGAAGAYTCVLTVRLFGPAVFVLLMMSRQTMSLVISVLVFQHKFRWQDLLCLIVVCLVVLVSSIRRVTFQLMAPDSEWKARFPPFHLPAPAG